MTMPTDDLGELADALEYLAGVGDGSDMSLFDPAVRKVLGRAATALRRPAANNAAAGERDAGRGEEGVITGEWLLSVGFNYTKRSGGLYVWNDENRGEVLTIDDQGPATIAYLGGREDVEWPEDLHTRGQVQALLAALGLPPRSAERGA